MARSNSDRYGSLVRIYTRLLEGGKAYVRIYIVCAGDVCGAVVGREVARGIDCGVVAAVIWVAFASKCATPQDEILAAAGLGEVLRRLHEGVVGDGLEVVGIVVRVLRVGRRPVELVDAAIGYAEGVKSDVVGAVGGAKLVGEVGGEGRAPVAAILWEVRRGEESLCGGPGAPNWSRC
jgi:hypothetical protein